MLNNPHRFCIAPMMECTDRHYRYLARLLTQKSMLYTEILTTGALLHGNREQLLKINSCEHPVALQLGGSNPSEMAKCSELASEFGYDEVNVNVGCPSNRVQAGKFGACLMLEPEIVAKCIKAMKSVTDIDITVKTRIGVDDQDSYENFSKFIAVITEAGCDTVIVHARKAFLSGLSPKENRTIPPLCYEYVHQLKQEFSHLKVIINGGLNDFNVILKQLENLNGVMIGRKAYEDPYFLAQVDTKIFNDTKKLISRLELLTEYLEYTQLQLDEGVPLNRLMRHTLGIFTGVAGAKTWRRFLSENVHKAGTTLDSIHQVANDIYFSRNLSKAS